MKKEDIASQYILLQEVANSFFGSKPEEKSKEDFKNHREEILAKISSMSEILTEYPAYGAVAFLGKFQFSDVPEIRILKLRTSAPILEAIRQKKALKVADSARAAWNLLMESNPETLCDIVALCFLANKPSITKLL